MSNEEQEQVLIQLMMKRMMLMLGYASMHSMASA